MGAQSLHLALPSSSSAQLHKPKTVACDRAQLSSSTNFGFGRSISSGIHQSFTLNIAAIDKQLKCQHWVTSSKIAAVKKEFKCQYGVAEVGTQNFDVVDDVLRPKVKKKKLAVFVSGGGSNFRAIHEAILQGSIHGDIVVLVTNRQDCGGANFARASGIPIILFPKAKDAPESLSADDLVIALRAYEVNFIILAGYLKLIPPVLVRAYPRSILNIHPSLLPAFGGKGYYGQKVHKAVIASGARFSGPTIHFVDEHYDTGRILAQTVVPVLAHDTAELLAARVLLEEHKLYAEVVAALCEERIIWREDGVPLIQSRENPEEFS